MSEDDVMEIEKEDSEVISIDSDTSEPAIIEIIDITDENPKRSKKSKKRSAKKKKKKKKKPTQLPQFIPISKNHSATKSKRNRHNRHNINESIQKHRASKLLKHMRNPIEVPTGCQVHDSEIESNIFIMNPNSPRVGLRPIIIDAATVATINGTFSMFSLSKCIKYFTDKGHKNIAAFLMPFHEFPSSPDERQILHRLRVLDFVFPLPIKRIDNHIVDISMGTHLVQYAASIGGVIISNRIFREEEYSKPNWLNVINRRLLNVVWMNGTFMIPEYPFNFGGPRLNEVLSFPECTCS